MANFKKSNTDDASDDLVFEKPAPKNKEGRKALGLLGFCILMIILAFPLFGWDGIYVICASIVIMLSVVPVLAVRAVRKDTSGDSGGVAIILTILIPVGIIALVASWLAPLGR